MAVFKKNGAWWIDCYLNGKRVRRKVGPDKRTAELAEKDLKVREARGEWIGIEQIKRITFEAFCEEFLSKQAGKAENTVRNYDKACRVHLIPFLGNRYLPNIRPKHIEDYKQMRAQEAAFSTVNLELQQLGTMLRTAVIWGYLKENPAGEIKRLKTAQKEPPYLTQDQVARIYPHCHDWLYTFVTIALNTGCRISEILALKWEDVDFRNGLIKMRSDEEFTTKGRRNREIPINGFLGHVLRKAPRHITNSHIIFTARGQCPDDKLVRKRFYVALKRAGLPHFRIHDMRHTFGTTLAANGVDVRTIQELMGHTDLKTTMRYLHAAPSRMRGAVENLHLDGTTQAEVEEEERENGHQEEAGK